MASQGTGMIKSELGGIDDHEDLLETEEQGTC